ncbi:hypothetical protein WMY93_003318 [Mugilogobius chulae]|uniref:Phosphatidic acid phosphatase type 2/haloperoxidase domain-containing protein n=1 Tax=Mugilogobius chulae TaxID=88201 RepID=A0AAW0PZI5_9GOBI
MFLLHNSAHLYDQDKVVMVGDCCYVNPMVRRTFRFIGVYAFGLFSTDIFINAGQLVTGSLTPHFLSVCQPNYTALSCQDKPMFISQSEACTGPAPDVARARKSFPCKEAALSLYTALYLTVYVMTCVGTRAGRLSAPLFCLALLTLALLTGFNRVAEYRNHWSDVMSGQAVGGAVAAFPGEHSSGLVGEEISKYTGTIVCVCKWSKVLEDTLRSVALVALKLAWSVAEKWVSR